ncbi:MAG: hypothetical protein HY710_11780 [Candidatus Latescibacteria bacterium]|nr:hypothetical protein [Candidatus Latescibacterota bacterium]
MTPSAPLSVPALLSRVEASASRLIDLKGTALVSASLHDQRGRADTRIFFRHPDQLKVVVDGPFGQVIAVIAVQGETVQFYLPLQNAVFEGTVEDRLDRALPGLNVRVTDIQSLIGRIDLTRYRGDRLIESRQDGDQYLLVVKDEKGRATRKIWIDANRSVVRREEEDREDGRVIVKTFDEYIRTKGLWRPSRARIVSGDGQEALTVQFYTQAVNTGLSAADLALTLPKTVKRLPMNP